ncbi:UNVERIFIED_CONTAM: hypothetical protein RMT77_002253 [Armadillidium vulgare]
MEKNMAWHSRLWAPKNINFLLVALSTTMILTLTMLIIKVVKRKQRLSVLDKIPSPKTNFFFGNIFELMGGPSEFFASLRTKFCVFPGGISHIWIMHEPFVIIYGASGVEALLNNSKNLTKGKIYTLLHSWLGQGLLTSTGSKWHARRKVLTPAFHFKILEDFIEVFNQQSQKLVNKLQKHSDGKPFNIFPYITLATLDIILESAMGRSINAQDDPESDYCKAIYEMGEIVLERNARPWLYSPFIFNMTKMGRREKEALNILHSFTLNTIKERRKEYKRLKSQVKDKKEDEIAGKKKRQAFLDLLIEYEEGHSLSENDIREEVDTFMFEGHDTTSSGITFAIYLLGQHPDIQDTVYEELESIFGESDRLVTSEDIRQMNYLECCIKESLRLLPPVYFFVRKLTEDLKIDEYVIPKGTDTAIFTYALHRDPKHFPDPLSFKPERFFPENSAQRNPYAYVPFSAGPRNCIGQKFALMEEKVVLSSFLRKYRVESLEKIEDLKLAGDLLLRPEKLLSVKIFPRK